MNIEAPGRRKNQTKVLLITPFQIIQKCLQVLIEENSDMSVLRSIRNINEISNKKDLDNIDLAIIYLTDGDVETVESISTLLQFSPEFRIIIVCNKEDITNQTRAIQLGAVGIVQKQQNARLLIEAIRQTSQGATWISQILLSKILKEKDQKKNGNKSWDGLTAHNMTVREKEVVTLIGKGLKNKDIAESLKISEATVRHHLSSIYGKAGVEDRLNLVIYAYQQGLINWK